MAVSIFGATKVTAPSRNIFDLSHSVKFTTNTGYLRPVVCMPVVPGDSFDIQSEVFCRLAPLATPVMANIDVKLEAFYVPNRLTWPNWEKFIVFEKRPDNDPKPVLPTLSLSRLFEMSDQDDYNRVGVGSLADDLGLPVTQFTQQVLQGVKVSALPFAAYQKIWLDYYCDKNFQQELIDTYYQGDGHLIDGDNTEVYPNLATLHHRMWRKDYFTSALPNAQRGADVLIPTQGSDVDISLRYRDASTGSVLPQTQVDLASSGLNTTAGQLGTDSQGRLIDANGRPVTVDNADALKGTLIGLNATITDLRTAMATQRLLELSMRVGSRLKEQLLGIFGVKTSDQRLDRAEFLGSAKVPIMVSEVAQTSATVQGQTPQANLAGRGIGAGLCNFGRKYFEEHGYLLIIASVVPKAGYFQGMPRHFQNFITEDFYWPMFQHIGEQAIKKGEIWFGRYDNDETFGYAPRYSEYKWMPSTVHGEFRSSLKNMHLARFFQNRPLLNSDFLDIKEQAGNRAFAVTSDDVDHFWLDIYFKIKAKRPMDYFGSPM